MASLGWLGSANHDSWLRSEERRLIAFPLGRIDAHEQATLLDHRGSPERDVRSPTYHTARMAHVHALAALRGHPGMRPVAVRLLDGLAAQPGAGWPDHPLDDASALHSLYALDHVLLAAATGMTLGVPSAAALLDRALDRFDGVFWEASSGRGVDRVNAAGEATDYRGMNSNMHLVEALLAVSDATGEVEWRDRAAGICRFVIEEASRRQWRICEHYDASWRPLMDYHRDQPHHPFAPYGSTVGHGFEWARLIAQLASAIDDVPMLEAANALFERAALDGWSRDGLEGFIYTVDWNGEPVSRQRLHWVAAEAVAAASVLARLPGGAERADERYELWLDHVAERFIDRVDGSWHQLLADRDAGAGLVAVPASAGKPDLYHSLQSILIPQLPVATSVAAAILRG